MVTPSSSAIYEEAAVKEGLAVEAGGAENLEESTPARQAIPVCVDLDGTLIRTDMLYESLLGLLRLNPFYILLIPFWLLKGKAYTKSQIARFVNMDVTLLPYNEKFLKFLRQQRSSGRPIVLVTASDSKFATQIVVYLGIFDGVVASDGSNNLSGKQKVKKLVELFGEHGFDYAGNSRADLKVWPYARQVIVVQPELGVNAAVKRLYENSITFQEDKAPLRSYLNAMRLHQWMKNVLIFAPLIAAHQFGNPVLLGQEILAFVAFNLCASSVYLINDLLDLQADRVHPRKRMRPFASGEIPVRHGAMMVPLLLVTASGIALLLPVEFFIVLAGYFVITLAYSFRLKRVLMLDVIVLAGLYTVRIIAGAAAASIVPSFWLLAFSMFLFLSLAIVKRYSELIVMKAAGRNRAQNRPYHSEDLQALLSLGAASGYISVLVFALFINSKPIRGEYATPEALWLACPLLLYWMSRIWIITRRGGMHDDPVIYTMQDRNSLITMLLVGLVFILATYYEY